METFVLALLRLVKAAVQLYSCMPACVTCSPSQAVSMETRLPLAIGSPLFPASPTRDSLTSAQHIR